MDIVMLLGVIAFVLLLVSWLLLPHTKELSEGAIEFSQIADEGQLAKASWLSTDKIIARKTEGKPGLPLF